MYLSSLLLSAFVIVMLISSRVRCENISKNCCVLPSSLNYLLNSSSFSPPSSLLACNRIFVMSPAEQLDGTHKPTYG